MDINTDFTCAINIYDPETRADSRVIMDDGEYQEYIDNLPVDYHGEKIFGSYDNYQACNVCQKGVFYLDSISGMCPLCVITAPLFWLEISFGKSSSYSYNTIVKRMKDLPISSGNLERHMLIIDGLNAYIEHRAFLRLLVGTASGWKSFEATINGEPVNGRQLKRIVEEVDYMLRDGK